MRKDRLILIGFCGFLICFLLLYLFLPEQDFSVNEKRYLANPPAFSAAALLDGTFSSDAESWASDHLPGRNFFIYLNAWADRLSNLQTVKEIYIGKSGRLYERPVSWNEEDLAKKISTLNTFSEAVAPDVYFMLIPSAGAIMRKDLPALSDSYPDAAIIDAAGRNADRTILHPVSLLPVFSAADKPQRLFYRTDHHWTSYGAYLADRTFLSAAGRAVLPEENYFIQKTDGFHGSLWSRACFWNIPGETIEEWDDRGRYSVTFSDREDSRKSLFFPERLTEEDKYTVFLNGNHPLVRIENEDVNATGTLLVIRDSFANCLGCFLAHSYKTVILVDLRYYRLPVTELIEAERVDDVLVVYSISNFVNDENFYWLR